MTIQTMEKKRQPRVAMIMGDAAGIGPEIVAKSLNTEETRSICIPAVIGDARVMAEAVKLTGVPLKLIIRRNWAEVTGEAALLVQPDDLDALADALRRVALEDGLCEELRSKGLRRAAAFTWRNTAELTLRAYEKSLE